MLKLALIGFLLTLPLYASSHYTEEEEEWTDLKYQTRLIEKDSYIQKQDEDYFVLNKKFLDEKKEIIKKISERDQAVEILKKGHEDSIAVLSRKLSDSQERLNKSKAKKRGSQEKLNDMLKKTEELEKEKNEAWELIHRMRGQMESLEERSQEYFNALNTLQNKVTPYHPYKIFFNPARRSPHKLISNNDLESEKWLLTDSQAYIITHLIDNATQIHSKKI